MRVKVTNEVEVLCKARAMQHVPSVAANRKDFASLDVVVFVEHKAAGVLQDGAFVDHRLAKVFAG